MGLSVGVIDGGSDGIFFLFVSYRRALHFFVFYFTLDMVHNNYREALTGVKFLLFKI